MIVRLGARRMLKLDTPPTTSGTAIQQLSAPRLPGGPGRLPGGTLAINASDGLVDAFAEVFARMSVSSAPSQDATQADPVEVDSAETETAETTENARDQTQSEAADRDVEAEPSQPTDQMPDTLLTATEHANGVAESSDAEAAALSDQAGAPSQTQPADSDSELSHRPESAIVDDGPSATKSGEATPQSAPAATTPAAEEAIAVASSKKAKSAVESKADGEPLVAENRPVAAGDDQDAGSKPDAAQSAIAESSTDGQANGGDAEAEDRRRYSGRGGDEGNKPAGYAADQQAQHPASRGAGSAEQAQLAADAASAEVSAELGAASDLANGRQASSMDGISSQGSSLSAPAAAVAARGKFNPVSQPASSAAATEVQPTGAASTAPAGAASTTAGKGKETGRSDVINRAKLVQRVSRAFQHLGPDGGSVRLRLAPAELGTVRIEMQIQNKQVRARVITESDAASQALREQLPDLRARLDAQGIQIERMEITTEAEEHRGDRGLTDQQNQHRHGGAGQQHSRQFTARESQPAQLASHRPDPMPMASSHQAVAGRSGVDIRL